MADTDWFVDVVIVTMYVLMAVAVAVSVWSAWRVARLRQRRQSTRIGYGVAGGVAVLLLLTYLLGSTAPLMSNGKVFDSPVWLRLTDMFIYSSLILIVTCSAVVVIARFRR